MRKVISIALAAIAVGRLDVCRGVDVYVSPEGSDATGDGSAAKPFESLGRVQAAVRQVLLAPLTEDVVVHVGPGTYYQRTALRFGHEDSGRDGYRVRWTGPGASAGFDPSSAAVIHGGVKVPPSAWARVGSSGVWVANISAIAPPPSPAPPPPPPPPTPGGGVVPVPNVTYSDCGEVLVGVSYDGNDIKSVWAGGIDECCKACASTRGCEVWSHCDVAPPAFCGTPGNKVDCYLKTKKPATPRMWDQRVSGTPGSGCRPTYPTAPPSPPPAPSRWRFFNVLEDRVGAVLARTPDFGSGYLVDLGCSNGDTSLTCPAGVLPTKFDVSDSSVFANLGSNWFTETRTVETATLASNGGVTVSFEKGNAMSANNKVYIQGAKEFISEPGEWALDSEAQMLYLWPRNSAAMAAGNANVVVTTTVRVLDITGEGWTDSTGLASAIDFSGLVVSGSDFSADYLIFTNGRPNDTPQKLREGMVRTENASDITFDGCGLLDAGHSAFWLQGFSQNVTVKNCWIERPGFCGAYFQGIFPGDTTSDSIGAIPGGAITSAGQSDVNKGHLFQNNMIFDYGTRVGHGSGFWFFQAGRTRLTQNRVQEGPRDAFGVYGIRRGVLPDTAYGVQMDFWTALDVLHTRYIEIDHNSVSNCVRDTSDAGALEYWGCGAWNTAHHNCFSDMDPGIPDGSWLNFLFQDDASHYLNFSSNIVFEVKGAGSEEGGMIKSIGSVFEANVLADAELGHVFNLCPFIEPSANMIYRSNVFANLSTAPGHALDTTINSMTTGTLATSGSLKPWKQFGFEKGPPAGWPPLALTDPVIKEFDLNTYYGVQGYNTSSLAPHGWDLHASVADPKLTRSSDAAATPWEHSCADYVPTNGSPVYSTGFRPINASSIGLDSVSFGWPTSQLLLRDASRKIQAERYQRMHGLWRLGSFCITGSSAAGFAFAKDAWARYDHILLNCSAPCTVSVRFRSDSTDPQSTRKVGFALSAPTATNTVASISTGPTKEWVILNATVSGGLTRQDATLFLMLDGPADIDYFWFH